MEQAWICGGVRRWVFHTRADRTNTRFHRTPSPLLSAPVSPSSQGLPPPHAVGHKGVVCAGAGRCSLRRCVRGVAPAEDPQGTGRRALADCVLIGQATLPDLGNQQLWARAGDSPTNLTDQPAALMPWPLMMPCCILERLHAQASLQCTTFALRVKDHFLHNRIPSVRWTST